MQDKCLNIVKWLIRPSVVVCSRQGSVLMNYSTLLDSIKKSAQTQAELINSEMKGVRCVCYRWTSSNHSSKSLSTAVLRRIMNTTGPQSTISVNIFLLCLENFA